MAFVRATVKGRRVYVPLENVAGIAANDNPPTSYTVYFKHAISGIGSEMPIDGDDVNRLHADVLTAAVRG
jgi:hypothetical protein